MWQAQSSNSGSCFSPAAKSSGAALHGAPGIARWIHKAARGVAARQLCQAFWSLNFIFQPFTDAAPRANALLRGSLAQCCVRALNKVDFHLGPLYKVVKYLPPCRTWTNINVLLNMCLLDYILQENYSVYTAFRRKEPRWGFGKILIPFKKSFWKL